MDSLRMLLITMVKSGELKLNLEGEIAIHSTERDESLKELLSIYPHKIYKEVDRDLATLDQVEQYATSDEAREKLSAFRSLLESLGERFDLIKEIETLQDDERINYQGFTVRLAMIYSREMQRLEKEPENLEAKRTLRSAVEEIKRKSGITKITEIEEPLRK